MLSPRVADEDFGKKVTMTTFRKSLFLEILLNVGATGRDECYIYIRGNFGDGGNGKGAKTMATT